MEKDLNKFKKGTKFVNIVSAVTKDDLVSFNEYSDDYLNLKCVKFIPASGAATRMFKDLYQYLDDHIETEAINKFFNELENIAFYEAIENKNWDKNSLQGRIKIIDYILNEGLNYGSLPKALIKTNAYGNYSTTPIDEHIFEGAKYLNADQLNFHFTISKSHETIFNE